MPACGEPSHRPAAESERGGGLGGQLMVTLIAKDGRTYGQCDVM